MTAQEIVFQARVLGKPLRLTKMGDISVPRKLPDELRAAIIPNSTAIVELLRSNAAPSSDDDRNDLGNARRLHRLHGHDVRWVQTWNAYFIFDGRLWVEDQKNQLLRWAEDVIRQLHEEAAMESDATRRGKIAEWALRTGNASRLEAMIRLLKGQPNISAKPDEFDSNPDLFSCTNGVLDLTTLTLRPHRREDMLTRMAGAPYEPDARSEMWEKHLVENVIDVDTISTLQRWAGYSLTALRTEDRFVFLVGPGGSGKTTTQEAMKATWGSYAKAIDFETLLAHKRNPSGPSDDIADLRGARLVIATETDEGAAWNTGKVKKLTGGDTERARFLFQSSFEFRVEFKLWLAANDEPHVAATNDAFWRRILKVPFPVRRSHEDQQDKTIKQTLTDPTVSGAAILAWAVEGLRAYRQLGLGVSQAIKDATQQYRKGQDTVAQFIAACCEMDPSAKTAPGALRAAYVAWCTEKGLKPAAGKQWSDSLGARGLDEPKRVHGSARYWIGVRLLDPLPVPPRTSGTAIPSPREENPDEGMADPVVRTGTREPGEDDPATVAGF